MLLCSVNDEKLKLKLSIKIVDNNIKLKNENTLCKYKLENVEKIMLIIDGLKKTEGLFCTFTETKEKITIHVNHKILGSVYSVDIPIIIEKEDDSENGKLKKQIKMLEQKIKKITTPKTKFINLPDDILLNNSSPIYADIVSPKTIKLYDNLHVYLIKYDNNYSNMIAELKQMTVKRSQSGHYNVIDNQDIYLNGCTWKLNTSISNILTYIYWKIIPAKYIFINFDIAMDLKARKCSHNESGGICEKCVVEFKKQRMAVDAEPCRIPYNFGSGEMAVRYLNIILLNYYSRQGKHFIDFWVRGEIMEYIEDTDYYYEYSMAMYFMVDGEYYNIKTHEPVQPEMENLYKTFITNQGCRKKYNQGGTSIYSCNDCCQFRPTIKLVEFIYRKMNDKRNAKVVYI